MFQRCCSDFLASDFLFLSPASLISQNRCNHNRPPALPPPLPHPLHTTTSSTLFPFYIYHSAPRTRQLQGLLFFVCSCVHPSHVCARECTRACVCALGLLCRVCALTCEWMCGACGTHAMKYSGERKALGSWKSLLLFLPCLSSPVVGLLPAFPAVMKHPQGPVHSVL